MASGSINLSAPSNNDFLAADVLAFLNKFSILACIPKDCKKSFWVIGPYAVISEIKV